MDQRLGLDRLRTAKGATYDSYENDKEHTECVPGTRKELLDEIEQWAASPSGKCIFWLNGMAGTGKTTIARTVARCLKDKRLLAASFFFKRVEEDRGNAKRLFSTLAKQLATRIPQLIPFIRKAVDDDPDISEKAPKEQFDKLILQPLLEIQCNDACKVVVIDALDECEGENEVEAIRGMLPQVKETNSVQLRFFLTSRPEWPIRSGFMSKSVLDNHQDIILHKIPEKVIKHNISLYFNHKFSEMRDKSSLPSGWPGNETIEALVNRAVPLFISAATLFRFICDPRWNPGERLEAILADQTVYASKMDGTYMPVLNQLLNGQDEMEARQLIHEFKRIVGTIILLFSPLSIKALAHLLDVAVDNISSRLTLLHSVLHIPSDFDTPVRMLHLSLRDFLLDPRRKDANPFWIDEKDMNEFIFARCLDVMQRSLKKNICGLKSYGTLRSDVDDEDVNKHLAPEVQYACRYWAKHFVQIQNPMSRLDKALSFLEVHFLHWVEAMSILGCMSEVVRIMDMLQPIAKENVAPVASEFLHDARRFVLKFRQIVESAPLQLYASGLVFAPRKSKIRDVFSRELPKWISKLPKTDECWSDALQVLVGHTRLVNSVTFSPNGQLLASCSWDKTIKLWDPTTGELHQTLVGHTRLVNSVAFSPDGQLLASCSWDKTIKLWDPTTGELHQTLVGHTRLVNSVAFSPDGRLLVSCSNDKTIKIWDPITGQLCQTLVGCIDCNKSVVFSPDGRLLASCSKEETIKLWDPISGQLRQTLVGHPGDIVSVAVSPDGRLLVSCYRDNTIEFWDPITGQLRRTLVAHTDCVESVAFSPDGRLLASCSMDKTIKLWDPTTGQLRRTLIGHTDWVKSVAFSSNGRLLASHSCDETIKLWDLTMDNLFWDVTGHSAGAGIKANVVASIEDRWVRIQGKKMLWLPPEYRPVFLALRDKGGTLLSLLQAFGTVIPIELQLRAAANESHGNVGRDSVDDVPANLVNFCGPHVY